MVTLTYADPEAWRRRHICEWIKAARRSVPGATFRYVWVLELQRRGAPHYHVLVWLPYGMKLPFPDRSGQWPHGHSRVELTHQPVGYIAKYASKGTDEVRLPRGAHIYGAGGMNRGERTVVRWWMLPRYVREHFDVTHRVIRAKRGGWVSLSTGEWLAAAYWQADGWRVDVNDPAKLESSKAGSAASSERCPTDAPASALV